MFISKEVTSSTKIEENIADIREGAKFKAEKYVSTLKVKIFEQK